MSAASPITLRFEATGLPKLDLMSESDPFLVVKLNGARVGTTEIIKNNPAPQWVTTVTVNYAFEALQRLDLEVYDADSNNTADLADHDFVGRATIFLGELLCAPMMSASLSLTGSKHPRAAGARAELTVRAEQTGQGGSTLRMKVAPKKTGLGPRRVTLKKTAEGASRSVPVASARAGKTLEASLGALCGGDLACNVEFEVSKTSLAGTAKAVGVAALTVQELVDAAEGAAGRLTLPLLKPAAPGSRPKEIGILNLSDMKRFEQPTFVNYLQGGLDVSLTVAIDFTGSNGNPSNPSSLHHYTQTRPTAYAQALEAVGNVLIQYDSDRSVPVFGFGGSPPNSGTSHCFPLSPSGDFSHMPCRSVADMLGAYYRGVDTVSLSGPTNFAPFLRQFRQAAEESAAAARAGGPLSFQVALILTDGAITDMGNTIDEVVALSALPAAIIIVGVGGANFSSMEELDADERPLYARSGVKAEADIVQFVPFRDYARSGPEALAGAVLNELPGQVVRYFTTSGITAPAPRAAPAAVPAAAPAAAPVPSPPTTVQPQFIVN